jgi:hypothetical protein
MVISMLKAMEKIREELGNSCFWIGVDETTDVRGRYIGNVIVGKLSPASSSKSFLIASKVLDAANHSTIIALVNDSIREFQFSLLY